MENIYDAGNLIHLWIVDKRLECYRNSGPKLKKEIVFKLLYLFETGSDCDTTKPKSDDLDVTHIPQTMFDNVCDELKVLTAKLPCDLQNVNEWSAAYIRHL